MASPSTVITMGLGSFGSSSLLLTLGYGASSVTAGDYLCGELIIMPALRGTLDIDPALRGELSAQPAFKGSLKVNPC